jgi:hypothetical protein
MRLWWYADPMDRLVACRNLIKHGAGVKALSV